MKEAESGPRKPAKKKRKLLRKKPAIVKMASSLEVAEAMATYALSSPQVNSAQEDAGPDRKSTGSVAWNSHTPYSSVPYTLQDLAVTAVESN